MSFSGILGSWQLYAGISQAVYVCDKTQASVVTLNVCNRSNKSALIRIAISSSQTTPLPEDWIEYDVSIPANGYLERSSLMVPTGRYIVVRSSINDVNAMCWGLEIGDDYAVSPIVFQTGNTPTWATAAGTLGETIAGSPASFSILASDADGAEITYSVTSGALPTGMALSSTGAISGTPPTTPYVPGGETSEFTVSATDGLFSVSRSFNITKKWYDGSTSALASSSALQLKTDTGINTDGTYWINIPTVGPQQVYCVMNSAMSGGGWMMMMKATRGNAFSYTSSYWTSVNTLNTTATNRNDGDAKFDVMNYWNAKDVMALWPDLANGGDVTGQTYGTIWIENNWYSGNRITPISFFNTVNNYNPNGLTPRNTKWNGGSQFSSQSGNQFYGFNFTANSSYRVRWGFAWNNENEWSSNDVGGGIGMNATGWSAGDYIACCNDVGGFNRSARVEMYVR